MNDAFLNNITELCFADFAGMVPMWWKQSNEFRDQGHMFSGLCDAMEKQDEDRLLDIAASIEKSSFIKGFKYCALLMSEHPIPEY